MTFRITDGIKLSTAVPRNLPDIPLAAASRTHELLRIIGGHVTAHAQIVKRFSSKIAAGICIDQFFQKRARLLPIVCAAIRNSSEE